MVVPIYSLNSINDAAALLLARGADFLSALDKPQGCLRNAIPPCTTAPFVHAGDSARNA